MEEDQLDKIHGTLNLSRETDRLANESHNINTDFVYFSVDDEAADRLLFENFKGLQTVNK
jgi:hypothetical protein